jgi:hypothetical protein
MTRSGRSGSHLAAWTLILAGLAGLLSSGPAAAQDRPPSQQDSDEARRRFQSGVQQYNQGNYPGALAEFEISYKLVPNPRVLYNVGLAQKGLHRYGEAILSLENYLARNKNLPADRVELVQKFLAEMRPFVTAVAISGLPHGAEVRIDGRVIGVAPLKPVQLQSGNYVLEASAEGFVTGRKEFTVRQGQPLAVEMNLKASPSTGKVSIVARPGAARLRLDGRDVGYGSAQLALTPGGHQLEALADGYKPFRSELTVAAGQDRDVSFELERLRPFYKTWWFWTTVAVVVAGGVVGGVLGSRSGEGSMYHGTLQPGIQYFQK